MPLKLYPLAERGSCISSSTQNGTAIPGLYERLSYIFQHLTCPHYTANFSAKAIPPKGEGLYPAHGKLKDEDKPFVQFDKSKGTINNVPGKLYNLQEDLNKRYALDINTPPSNPLEELVPCLSDLLLQVQLGTQYVKADNFQDFASRRKADILNLKKYHELYSHADGELKREIKPPLETDFERISDVFEIERHHKGWIALHHCSNPDVKYFWTESTVLHQLLTLQPVEKGTNPAMRATDIYFRGHTTMQESVQKTGTGDYDQGNASRRLCGNWGATAGLKTTRTSSSSWEYFFLAHSVLAPSTAKRFEESAQLLGMVNTSYLPYQSIFEQFIAHPSEEAANSPWTIVLINPDILDTFTYSALDNGKFFNPAYPKRDDGQLPSSTAVYNHIRTQLEDKIRIQEMQTSSSASTSTTTSDTRILVDSMGEMRLLLHPSIMYDSDKTKVISVDRIPSTKPKKFKDVLTSANIYDAGHWLSMHTKLMPDSFYGGEPALKKQYRYAHKGVTGQDVVETVTKDGFYHLVKNGHYDGAKQFFESYPEMVKQANISPRSLTLSAIESGNDKLLDFILTDVVKKSINDILTPEDISALVRSCLVKDHFFESHKYILQHYDLNKISNETKLLWAQELLKESDDFTAAIDFFHTQFHPFTDDQLNDAIKEIAYAPLKLNSYPGLIDSKVISKVALADKLIMKYLTHEHRTVHPKIGYLIKLLLEKGLDYKEVLPTSGNPVLFSLPFLNTEQVKMEPKFIEALQNDPKLLDYQNKEGLNLLQFIQKSYLEGAPFSPQQLYLFWNTILENNMTSHKRSYVKESYQPFLEEFGENEFSYTSHLLPQIPPQSPFQDPLFVEWSKNLHKTIKTGTVTDVLSAFNQIPDPSMLYRYHHMNVSNYILDKFVQRPKTLGAWVNSVIDALKNGNVDLYNTPKTTKPTTLFLSSWDTHLTPLVEAFPNHAAEIKTIIDANSVNAIQLNNSWKSKIEALLKGNYKDLFSAVKNALEEVANIYDIKTLVSNYMPQMWDIQEKNKKPTLSYFDYRDLISKPDQFLQAINEGEITQEHVNTNFHELFTDANLALVEKVLTKLYPNPKDLITQKDSYGYTIMDRAIFICSSQEQIFKALLKYGGYFAMLKDLKGPSISTLLHYASKTLLESIETESPEIFSHGDFLIETFLTESALLKRFGTFQFITKNLVALKKLYDPKTGIPLLFTLYKSPELLQQLAEYDPSILNLKALDGSGIETLLEIVMGEDHARYEYFMQIVEMYKKQ